MQQLNPSVKRTQRPARQWSERQSEAVQGDSSDEDVTDDALHSTVSTASLQSDEADDSEREEEEEDEGDEDEDDSGRDAQADSEELSVSQRLDGNREDEQDEDEIGHEQRRLEAAEEDSENAHKPLVLRPTLRLVEESLRVGEHSAASAVVGAPRIDSEGNSSILHVSWTEVHIVESFHAPPDSTSPRNRRQTSEGSVDARDDGRRGGKSGGSHLKHFLQVRKRRHELQQQQAMDRPRSLSQVSAAAPPILPPSPSFHAVGSVDTVLPMLAVVASSSASDTASGFAPPPHPTSSLPLTLSPALSAYPAVRLFASGLFFPSAPAPVPSPPSSVEFGPSFLPDNSKVRRALRLLDRVAVRETFKVGLLYCGRGQDSQRAILSNAAGSAAYEQFVSGLGWDVQLSSHRGFTGGLDDGERSVYFSDSTCELMWHVATRMSAASDGSSVSSETAEADRSLLRKKRHIGNDYVHVVWSEHWLDYAADTISSHFNHVHIVLYPIHQRQQLQQSLPQLACRVQVFSKPSVPLFGPLQSHMLVPLHCLPALVRLTVINANRAIRHSTPNYLPPYPTRRALLSELIGKAALQGRTRQTYTAAVTQQHTDHSEDDDTASGYGPLDGGR